MVLQHVLAKCINEKVHLHIIGCFNSDKLVFPHQGFSHFLLSKSYSDNYSISTIKYFQKVDIYTHIYTINAYADVMRLLVI